MKRLFLITLVIWGCTENRPTYNLETLNSDLVSFGQEEQIVLVNFSSEYEKSKSLKDSISGVPVVLVPSLTYSEILEFIEAEQTRQFTLDSLNYLRIVENAQINGKTEINGISFQRWLIDENFLERAGLMLTEGRNFSTAFDDEMKIIISEPLANKLNLGIGETIELDNTKTIIGIFENLATNYPTPEHLIVAELKK
ncbi:ABC transporter permease [Ekhidna sp.]|uniref:ABC transporter permease n=1 Tax=Ekhidna sp. TaxID=2608089 RepID=UPI003B5BD4D4